jgi:hypothetical protein
MLVVPGLSKYEQIVLTKLNKQLWSKPTTKWELLSRLNEEEVLVIPSFVVRINGYPIVYYKLNASKGQLWHYCNPGVHNANKYPVTQ